LGELISFCIMFWISFDVRNLIGCVICSGSFSALLIPVSRSSFCGRSFGLNVFSKCPAKVLAFFIASSPALVRVSDYVEQLKIIHS
jgi:hypothetical protein